MTHLILERELAYQLYDVLDCESLLHDPRYAHHSRETFDRIVEASRDVATRFFAPHYASGDGEEPRFENGKARVSPENAVAWRAFADAGFLNAHWSEAEGGLGVPEVVLRAAMSSFYTANVATTVYPMLAIGAANLLRSFASDELKQRYLPLLARGEMAATMALTEPGQGSSLGDIRTQAVDQGDGTFRITGQKTFISGGDQDITPNILHLVLARIQGAPAGAKGVSLFAVPKYVEGMPNDVTLVGLIKKMGWRNSTSAILSFGDAGGAKGYLVGQPGAGLAQMFQMMNEARIGVGLIAACLSWRGYATSLAYAADRRQGRLPGSRGGDSPQVRLIEHPDVKRLLLQQRVIAEGSLALCFYASWLFDEHNCARDARSRSEAAMLLGLLTPAVKSWPSKHGCDANAMAMQVLGGAGYTRDHVVEQLYRDQRLNPIHEGAEAIHGLDLLGRKICDEGPAALHLLCEKVLRDCSAMASANDEARELADALQGAVRHMGEAADAVREVAGRDRALALANATAFLDAFGSIAVGWMWLRQAAANKGERTGDSFHRGKRRAAAYMSRYMLPEARMQLKLVCSMDDLTTGPAPEGF